MKILVTCPPMLGMIDDFADFFGDHNMEVTAPKVEQQLTVEELKRILPGHEGWIIGDDPVTREVLEIGKAGGLKAAIRWGIGTDNVDFKACKDLGIPITNTPNMFGQEVADVAMGYIIGLARETFLINAGVRKGEWPKIRGISLSGKIVGLIGFGDIGKQTAKRALAANMKVIVYDPFSADPAGLDVRFAKWPNQVEEADFVVATCALTNSSRHMLNKEILQNRVKKGVRIVNVSRGPVIDEQALTEALHQGRVHSVALDVFEKEPLPKKSNLRSYPRAVFGSHNSSNTIDAVRRASIEAIKLIKLYLD